MASEDDEDPLLPLLLLRLSELLPLLLLDSGDPRERRLFRYLDRFRSFLCDLVSVAASVL